MVPNFFSNYHSLFDNNGKCAKELFVLFGLTVSCLLFKKTLINFMILFLT